MIETNKNMNEEEAIAALKNAFEFLKIKAQVDRCRIASPLYKFSVRLDGGSINTIEKRERELAMSMRSVRVPLVLPNFRDGTVELDFMFDEHPIVPFADIVGIARKEFEAGQRKPGHLDICLGATEVNKPLIRDLAKMPHLLIAGATGSGKTMTEHAIIASLTEGVLVKPDVKLYLIDPKMVEFSRYDKLPQLAYDIGHTVEDCVEILKDIEDRMRTRLEKMAEKGCKDIDEYRARGHKMSDVVLIIDEMADLMKDKKSGFEKLLCTIAAMGRAAGIYIVAATQHPSRDVVSGLIKANFPARIGCKVSTQTHSRVILDENGAENLAGRGDSLLIDGELHLVRYMGALVNLIEKIAEEPIKKTKSGLLGRLLGR